MSIVSDSVLVESRAAREHQLGEMPHERAAEIKALAKALLLAFWQGTGVTTTEEIVRYYEVESSVVRHASKQHRDELISDGWREVRGIERLQSLRSAGCEVFSLPVATTRVAIWTPRAALRLGMVLQTSPIAKAVRTIILDAVEVIPAAAGKLRELELQLAIAQAQREAAASHAETAKTQERLMAASQLLGSINPDLPLLILRPDVKVIERSVPVETTVLVNEHNNKVIARYDGVGISFLAQRYGFGKGQRANNACRQWLLSIGVTEEQWVEEPTAHTTRKLPRQMLAMLDRQFGSKQGSRQRLLGE